MQHESTSGQPVGRVLGVGEEGLELLGCSTIQAGRHTQRADFATLLEAGTEHTRKPAPTSLSQPAASMGLVGCEAQVERPAEGVSAQFDAG